MYKKKESKSGPLGKTLNPYQPQYLLWREKKKEDTREINKLKVIQNEVETLKSTVIFFYLLKLAKC